MSDGIDPRLRNWLEFYDELGLTPLFRNRQPRESDPSNSTQPAHPAMSNTSTEPTASVKGAEGGADDRAAVPGARRPADSAWAQTVSLFDEGSGPRAEETLEDIRTNLGECTRCKLHKGRTTIVFGEGSEKAKLVFIGEGPGADEDAQGRPFVGRAGKLLTRWIESMEMKREEVYICNVVKCRPPGNRAPEKDEVQTCSPFLFRQLDAIRPRLVCCLGATALQALLGKSVAIGKMRGQFFDYRGAKMVALYHPAYLLRPHPPKVERELKRDLQKIRDFLQS